MKQLAINHNNLMLTNNDWKGISFTKTAIAQIKRLFLKKINYTQIKLDLKKSGCAGFRYSLTLTKEKPSKLDLKFKINQKITLVVPIKSMPVLDGTQIDFVQEGIIASFKFKNKNIKNSCGCGESFEILQNDLF
ncbi:iron-sulfur cluster assembly accessory protein [Buchnera aphidicola (Hormaphis cornu)]|nr:iron-sulfur cluster assembly accessory protein [Buchnera aphidicola (Hormaphis cornu)]